MRSKLTRAAAPLLLAALLLAHAAPAAAQEKDEPPESGPLACAFFFASRPGTEEHTSRNTPLSYVARYSWLVGKPDQALRAVRAMSCDDRAYVANNLAGKAIKAGRKDHARKFIEQALSCAEENEDFYQQGMLFNEFVEKLIELQDYDRALAAADGMEDDSWSKALAYANLAGALAKAGQAERASALLERALAQARSESEDYSLDTCKALARIAAAYAQLGKTEQAAAALSLATRLTEQVDELNRDQARTTVAAGYAAAGLDGQALHLTGLVAPDRKADALTAVASAYVRAGDRAKALPLLSQAALAVEAEDNYENARGGDLLKIVQVYLEAGEPGLASEVARRITYNFYIEAAAVALADWALEHGRAGLGVEALDYAFRKFRLLRSEKREEILPEMSSSTGREKAVALAEIADKYLAAGRLDRAQQAAEAIDLPQWKADKLADVAGAARSQWPRARVKKQLARALRLSETSAAYPHDVESDWALANIARRYAEAGDREQASRLFLRLVEMARRLDSDEYRIEKLAEIGVRFELAGMRPDAPLRNVLRRIIKEWAEI